MEVNLVRDAENNKKGLYKYVGQKNQANESILPLLNENGELATTDMENTDVLNKFFASVFSSSQDSLILESYIPEPQHLCRNGGSKLPHTEQV